MMKKLVFPLGLLLLAVFGCKKTQNLDGVSDCLNDQFEAFKALPEARQIMKIEDAAGKKHYWLRDDSRYADGCEKVLDEDCGSFCSICGFSNFPAFGVCAQPESAWVSIWIK